MTDLDVVLETRGICMQQINKRIRAKFQWSPGLVASLRPYKVNGLIMMPLIMLLSRSFSH